MAVLRLDVLPTLEGIEPGLASVPALRCSGVSILNAPWALLGAHDKVETARRLRRAGVAHPATVHVRAEAAAPAVRLPAVVKPRFGKGARSLALCATERELAACLRALDEKP